MDKNEILKRSQTENILGDEREKQIRLESDTFSLIFMLAVTLILTTVNYVKGLSADGFLAIFWASIVGRYFLSSIIITKPIMASCLWLPPYFVSQTSRNI